MPYGVVPEGFNRKLLQNVLDELQAEQRAEIHPKLNTSPSGPHGQLNASFSREIALAWEALEAAYHSIDRDKAEGDALDSLGKLTGTPKGPATYGEVTATVNADIGTILVSDSHFAEVDGAPAKRFTPKADFEAPSTGNHSVLFRAENSGPVTANAGTLTVISTPVTGWNSITNALDAAPGSNEDTDAEYRARQEADVARAGSASVRAIRADLLALEVDGVRPVLQCTVLENDTDVTDSNGLPPHSIEAVILDSPAVDDDLIAETIFVAKAAGIGANGTESGDVLLPNGQTKTIHFSRPTEVPLYIDFFLTTETGYVGDALFETLVVTALREVHLLSTNVLGAELVYQAKRISGVVNCSVEFGKNATPSLAVDVPIGDRELATFDTSRITVTATPVIP